ncbi:urease accessory protein UreE [Microcystis aeruginosa]|jgi:urease accessory protein|uniref:urease accessory protein UreE n=1 Tax=Microcystis aeruginosa TaxID=1126 RepID=UPI000261E99D|nr:urease accessory protein UreE [Microcystis aeruginosa]CCI08913.1 Urease accessory protein ureE [Microcystis aeruginosa PCC 7941]
MLTFTERLPPRHTASPPPPETVVFSLLLTAEERTRSRYRLDSPEGFSLCFRLPRGTILQDRDFLRGENGEIVQIIAKTEPVITITAPSTDLLLKAAYHLGNRHVALEINPDYLRLAPDSVLQAMLEGLGLTVTEEIAPFNPEIGAYQHYHDLEEAKKG